MPQSLSNVIVHIVFSTIDRRPFLRGADIRAQMHQQIGSVSKRLECPPITVGGVEDHVHILARQARTIGLADWLKELKRVTSVWIKNQDRQFRDFHWQAGYGAFSVSQSRVDAVVRYIEQQPVHHRKVDFQMEYRALLKRHGIPFDERYVWD